MSSRARATPIRWTSRCVPPMPGMTPRPTSGMPTLAPRAARMKSQASASSNPPPSAKPFTAAITGIRDASKRSPSRCAWATRTSAAAGSASDIALMSAPAANALSPAPVRMAQRMLAVALERRERLGQRVQRLAVERVARLRAVDADDGERALARDQRTSAAFGGGAQLAVSTRIAPESWAGAG